MNTYLKLALCMLPPLIAGIFGGIATAANINNWYAHLVKPVFNPPNYLFGPVWTILYLLMGVSFFMIMKSPASPQRTNAIFMYWLQLILNVCWSFIFFKFHWIGLAFLEIVTLWLCILVMILRFEKLNKRSAYLQLPYLCWVLFASFLNGSIWWLN